MSKRLSMEMDYESASSSDDYDDDYDSIISDNFSAEKSSDNEIDSNAEESKEYNPNGVESDDDDRGCCHWSRTPYIGFQDTIKPVDDIPEYGGPAVEFPDDANLHNVVESKMDDEFNIRCIESTNQHGSKDPNICRRLEKSAVTRKV